MKFEKYCPKDLIFNPCEGYRTNRWAAEERKNRTNEVLRHTQKNRATGIALQSPDAACCP